MWVSCGDGLGNLVKRDGLRLAVALWVAQMLLSPYGIVGLIAPSAAGIASIFALLAVVG